jgi:hypothetical protein
MRTRCTGHTTIAAEVSVDTESRRMTPLGRSRSRRGGAAEDTIAQMKSAMTFGLGVALKAQPANQGWRHAGVEPDPRRVMPTR